MRNVDLAAACFAADVLGDQATIAIVGELQRTLKRRAIPSLIEILDYPSNAERESHAMKLALLLDCEDEVKDGLKRVQEERIGRYKAENTIGPPRNSASKKDVDLDDTIHQPVSADQGIGPETGAAVPILPEDMEPAFNPNL